MRFNLAMLTMGCVALTTSSAMARPNAPSALGARPPLATRMMNGTLDVIEPKNESGLRPQRPISLGVGALNVLETAAARLLIMRPWHRYSAWVTPGVLMRGSQPTRAGLAALKAQGIKTVINLRLESNREKRAVEALGMKAVQIPLYDQSLPTHREVARFLRVTMASENQPAIVHCEQGRGRTGMFVAFHRIVHDGVTADEAVAEAKQAGLSSAAQEHYIRRFALEFARGRYRNDGFAPVTSPAS